MPRALQGRLRRHPVEAGGRGAPAAALVSLAASIIMLSMKTYTLPNGTIKSHLCKYYASGEFLIDTIENARMWFADPLGFNDPYDCNLDYTVTLKDDWVHELQETRLDAALDDAVKLLVASLEKNPQARSGIRQILERIEHRNIQKEIDERGIACFSRSEYILLLWSHYAGKHTGVCLKFDISKDEEFFNAPYLIDYPERMPRFNMIDILLKRPHSGIVQHALATKSKDWEYEQEVRIVKWSRFGPFRGLINFNRDSLIEVCFGYRTSLEDKEKISSLLYRSGYRNTEVYEMKLRVDDFGLAKQHFSPGGS
ncbi:MAG TPA: DUF2971 domain-containing protein [Longimicrobium sp.]